MGIRPNIFARSAALIVGAGVLAATFTPVASAPAEAVVATTVSSTAVSAAVPSTVAAASKKYAYDQVKGFRRHTNQIWDDKARKMQWTKLSGVKKYQFQVSTNKSFTNIIQSEIRTKTFAYAEHLGYKKTYYARVRAYSSSSKVGPWAKMKEVTFDWTKPATDFVVGEPYIKRGERKIVVSWKEQDYAWVYTAETKNSVDGVYDADGKKNVDYKNFPMGSTSGDIPGSKARYTTYPYANWIGVKMRSANRDHSVKPSSDDNFYQIPGGLKQSASGYQPRVGSYNVCRENLCGASTARARLVAANILKPGGKTTGPTVVAMQETNQEYGDANFGTKVVGQLNDISANDWALVDGGRGDADTSIAYRTNLFTVVSNGHVGNLGVGAGSTMTWAKLQGTGQTDSSFVLGSLQLSSAASSSERKAAATRAYEALDDLAGGLPIVIAGDLGGNKVGDAAHVALIESGKYFDTSSALTLTGREYDTHNHAYSGGSKQTKPTTEHATRRDFILVKGLKGNGSIEFHNVPWKSGTAPSDHNLQWTRLSIPR